MEIREEDSDRKEIRRAGKGGKYRKVMESTGKKC